MRYTYIYIYGVINRRDFACAERRVSYNKCAIYSEADQWLTLADNENGQAAGGKAADRR